MPDTITINDQDYEVADLNDQQKYLLSQIQELRMKKEDLMRQTDVTGFIAQECEEAGFEEFVDTVDFSETIKNVKTFGYGGLVPALVKAIQEQQEQIEALQSEINTLKGG